MLEIAAESPASGARFVSVPDFCKTRWLKKQNTALIDLILHAPQFFTSLTFQTKPTLNYKNAKAKNLPKPMLKTIQEEREAQNQLDATILRSK